METPGCCVATAEQLICQEVLKIRFCIFEISGVTVKNVFNTEAYEELSQITGLR